MYFIPLWLKEYAEEVINKNSFDASHDMTHFLNVYEYAKKIVEENYKDTSLISNMNREDSINILLHASFCHDLIDSKYVDSKQAIDNLRNVFLQNGYNKEHLDIIIFLIDNMSYSKRKKGIIITKEYELIMNILCDADMLDAYRVERVIFYQEHKSKNLGLSETEREKRNKGWIKTILVKRVLEYKDKWLKTKYAKSIAPSLHQIVEDYVNENLKDVEMFDY